MKNIFIINAHEYYPFAEGKLNNSFTKKAKNYFEEKRYNVRVTTMKDDYDVEQEIENHLWADVVFLQSPVNWMGHPWSFKKYADMVYTTGMMGKLCNNDGRSSEEPKKNYGTGGMLGNKKYMISLTFNAPKESFNDQNEYLFGGKSVDDLFFPTHMNFRFFGMTGMETFASYDVMKNPEIENDFVRFEQHLEKHFPVLVMETK
ncbi:NAD(P)H-dependent oxidoreductase [Bernardetia sp. OM2101]|uniref:NAD(P)H-dependent oxidoreductase n=1 Tax=Bernardetia sp. OM2101 TaxID=3344876 RepID=UPI0035CFC4EC